MNVPRLVRRVRRGEPITAEAWNAMVDYVLALRPITGPGSGVQLFHSAAGTAIRAAGGSQPFVFARISGAIGPATVSGSTVTYDTGTANLLDVDVSAPEGVEGSNSVTVYNYWDATIADNAFVRLDFAYGVWWVSDVMDCADLS